MACLLQDAHSNTDQPVGMLYRLKLLLPLLLSLPLGFPPPLLCSCPVLCPLGLPFSKLGLPVALDLYQSALPLLLCLCCLLLLCLDGLCNFSLPVSAVKHMQVGSHSPHADPHTQAWIQWQ